MRDAGVNVSEPISWLLYCISNSVRRSMLSSLARYQGLFFSELMKYCGLGPKYNTTGTFTHHLSELGKICALRKTDAGYSLTEQGRRKWRNCSETLKKAFIYT